MNLKSKKSTLEAHELALKAHQFSQKVSKIHLIIPTTLRPVTILHQDCFGVIFC